MADKKQEQAPAPDPVAERKPAGADVKEPDKSGIEEQDIGPRGVISVTKETPAKADESSYPGPGDAKPNQPPVRTNRPDVAIADALAEGAGAHQPGNLDAKGDEKEDESSK